MRRICRVISHVGVFEGSFPKILKDAPDFTRSHLVVLRDCIPDLKHLIRYASDTVPVVGKISGLADQGTADLAQASGTLREIRKSTEHAVNEIFGVLDKVDPLLARAARAEGGDEETRKILMEARGQLTLILNALQFQDITSQQIESANALLANMGNGLVTLAEGMGERVEGLPAIEVRKGTFDPNASFDRGRAQVDQEGIDGLLEGTAAEVILARVPDGNDAEKGGSAPRAASPAAPPAGGSGPGNGRPSGGSAGTGPASVNQDDIDAILGGSPPAGQVAAKGQASGQGGEANVVDQDDIDALLKG